VLEGHVVRQPETHYSPSGIPISRLLLEHRSRQTISGMERELSFRIAVTATGKILEQTIRTIQSGDHLQVEGSLGRAGHRNEEIRLVLHAERIERLD